MSVAPSTVALPVSATVTAATTPAAIPALEATDLERLRSLLQQTASQTVNPTATPPAPEVAGERTRSLGDSILEGMMRFREGYHDQVRSINQRIEGVAQNEMAGLNDFSQIMSLQIDVSKWSMAVMGVDNASKAGTNTIKELSRG